MSTKISAEPVELQELSRVSDRLSFLFVERASVSREDNSLTFLTEAQTVPE